MIAWIYMMLMLQENVNILWSILASKFVSIACFGSSFIDLLSWF